MTLKIPNQHAALPLGLALCGLTAVSFHGTGMGSGKAWAGAGEEKVVVEPAARAQMTLCTDGKSHYVAVGPSEQYSVQLYYGDGKKFVVVPHDSSGMLSGSDFLEPRRFNETANPSFRGLDMRIYSSVSLNAEKTECAVRCGDRTTKLSIVAADKAKEILKDASFGPNPQKYVPHALTRDDRGNYYYVDRGNNAQTEKSFRLFVGRKGDLKQQKMTNVVSDSEGEIFSTATGSLRLVLDKNESTWISDEKPTKL